MGGWVAGLSENKASKSRPAELELGLGLAWQKLWDPGKYNKLIRLIKIISRKYSNDIDWKDYIRHNLFTK